MIRMKYYNIQYEIVMKLIKVYSVLSLSVACVGSLWADPCLNLSREQCEIELGKIQTLKNFIKEFSYIPSGDLNEKKFLTKFADYVFGHSVEIVVDKKNVPDFLNFFNDIQYTVNKNYRELGYVNISQENSDDNEQTHFYFSWESGDQIGEIVLKFQ